MIFEKIFKISTFQIFYNMEKVDLPIFSRPF